MHSKGICAGKACAHAQVRVDTKDMLDWCLNRNWLYNKIMAELPIFEVVLYERLKENPIAALAPVLKELGVPSTSVSSRMQDHHFVHSNMRVHPRTPYSYITNAEEVRRARPEKLDLSALLG